MKNINALLLISLFLGAVLMPSCKKDNDPSQAEITENNIQAVLDSIIENTHVPGLVAGIWAPNEGIDFVYAAGVSNLETKAPLSPDMIFRIASNTKTFTITVLLQLADEGLITLDDPLSDYLPDFPRANEVTIEMLTNMRSGIFSFTESLDYYNLLVGFPTRTWTTDELIAIAAGQPYYFDPGTGFHYSNSNTVIAGKIIELVTDASLEYNMRTRIIDPLNLINTVYLVGGSQIPGYHSSAYYGGEYDPTLPDVSEYLDISYAGAAGSAISNIYELKTYVEELSGGQFLTPTMQQKRLDCHDIGSPLGLKYGMGIFNYKSFYGHNGSTFGYTSLMIHSPERNCTIIIWYNCQINETTPTDLLYVIPKLIYQDI
jgi:D-alanyl-D-alanine carboxypeptidase